MPSGTKVLFARPNVAGPSVISSAFVETNILPTPIFLHPSPSTSSDLFTSITSMSTDIRQMELHENASSLGERKAVSMSWRIAARQPLRMIASVVRPWVRISCCLEGMEFGTMLILKGDLGGLVAPAGEDDVLAKLDADHMGTSDAKEKESGSDKADTGDKEDDEDEEHDSDEGDTDGEDDEAESYGTGFGEENGDEKYGFRYRFGDTDDEEDQGPLEREVQFERKIFR